MIPLIWAERHAPRPSPARHAPRGVARVQRPFPTFPQNPAQPCPTRSTWCGTGARPFPYVSPESTWGGCITRCGTYMASFCITGLCLDTAFTTSSRVHVTAYPTLSLHGWKALSLPFPGTDPGGGPAGESRGSPGEVPGEGTGGGSRGVIPLIWAAAVHCPATHHWVVKLFPYSSHCITPTPPRNSHATSPYLPPRTWRTSRGVARTWRPSTSLGFSTTLHTLHCIHYTIT